MTAVQRDINSQMRAILIDWLVEVAEEYHLHPETLYICVRGPWGHVPIVCVGVGKGPRPVPRPPPAPQPFEKGGFCGRCHH